MRIAVFLGLGGLLFAQPASSSDIAGDPAAGRQKAAQCVRCHGVDGYAAIPDAPHIAGEPASFLAAQLDAFRADRRTSKKMRKVIKTLSDQDIADLAAWYASQTIKVALPAGTMPDAAPGSCVYCHGTDGIATVDGVPHIAGESMIYLETQLKAFRSGERQNEIMREVTVDLSDDEIRSLAEWYSNVTLTIDLKE